MAAAKAPAGQPEGPGADRRGRHAGSGAPGSGREARLGAGEELLRALPAVLAGAAGVWLGIQGLRLFLTMVVWNVAEDQPATRMALWALGLYLPGLLAWVPARLAGGARPAWRFGLLFGLLTALRPVRFGPVWTPALAFAAWIAWLWWWPAFLRELVRRRALGAAVPGILLGLMAQVAGQTALGGLDLPYLRSPGARGATVLLVGAFLLCLWQLHRGPDREDGAPVEGEEAGAALGAALTGPYLFLQLTWLANLGRIETLGGWELAPAALFVQAGLAAGLLGALAPVRSRPLGIGLAALGVGLALAGERLSGPGLWLLIPLQFCLGAALAAAWAAGGLRGRIYAGAAAGFGLVFVLLFLYYSRYGWPALWPVAAGLVALPLGLHRAGGSGLRRAAEPGLGPRPAPADAAVAGGAGLAALGPEVPAALRQAALALAGLVAALTLVTGYLGQPPGPPGAGAGPGRAPAELKVLDYNIHNGLDWWSLPSMEAIAEVIARADADLVALQEVNRGWNLSGGVDLVAWLRRRFPGYHLVYGPMNGPLWGNVILSRYPVAEWGTYPYTPGASDFPRGLVWARIETEAGDLLFISTHLTAYAGFDADRAREAAELVAFWNRRPRTVIAGDLNARPGEPAIEEVLGAGLRDVPAALGLGEAFTYSAGDPYERIDYVFASPDVLPVAADVPATLASDHLPVLATVRLQPDGTRLTPDPGSR